MKSLSVVIPNYNGREYLKKNIPPLLKELKRLKTRHEVIISDDCSTDHSAEYISNRYPFINVVRTKFNSGFGEACNLGVKESTCDLIYLMNTDVTVTKGFLNGVLEKFQEKNCFAVGSVENSTKNIYIPVINMKFGIFIYKYMRNNSKVEYIPSVFVSGGHSAFDRRKFNSLGGFNKIYSPFLWEDMDICYRANKKGLKSYYCRSSLVYHQKGGTIKKNYNAGRVSRIHWRNRFLFIWSNLSGRLLFVHLFYLPWVILGNIFYRPEVTVGFLLALSRLWKAIMSNRGVHKYSDAEIIKMYQKA